MRVGPYPFMREVVSEIMRRGAYRIRYLPDLLLVR